MRLSSSRPLLVVARSSTAAPPTNTPTLAREASGGADLTLLMPFLTPRLTRFLTRMPDS